MGNLRGGPPGGAAEDAAAPPGWHGKLPSLGDFASRRLPPDFISAWDHWLASGLQQLRERDTAGWLSAYLASPSRRFLLMPGVMPGVMPGTLPGAAGTQAWAGVLMPSVDRVGRYFPFTIAQPCALPATPEQMQSLWFWLGRLDELAGDALHEDWSVDQLEAELARMAGPDLPPLGTPLAAPLAAQARPPSPGACVALPLAPGVDITRQVGIDAQALWLQQAQGLAYWYAHADLHAPSLFVSKGLPASAADLLGATM